VKTHTLMTALVVMMVAAATAMMAFVPSAGIITANAQGTPRQDPGQPPDANCWGEINSGLAQDDFGSPGVGEHASDPVPGDDDRETPRAGVGNQAEDTPGEHAKTVGPLFGQPCEP
jgi:hypothetical protein